MAFELMFSDEFFGDCENARRCDHPTNVADALMSIPDDEWSEICREVFRCHPDHVDIQRAMDQVRETNTCGDISAPVDVWIDSEGWYTVNVYDALDNE